MKPLSQSLLTITYSFLGLCMMVPFITSFIKEELQKKLKLKRIRVVQK